MNDLNELDRKLASAAKYGEQVVLGNNKFGEQVFKTPHSSDWHREIAENNTILLTEVGSTMHGVSVKRDDDVDEMGICIPPPEVALGVRYNDAPLFEQYEFRTQPVGERSGAGDVDRIIYSLRKYVRMAAAGSPTVQMPLFAQEGMIRVRTGLGIDLRDKRDMFLSKQIGFRFKGYLMRQRSHLDGTLAVRVHRPELVEEYGYDTKYAYHALRLAYQGHELLTTGKITLPIPPEQAEYLLDIRAGKYKLHEVLVHLDHGTEKLQKAIDETDLPQWPDFDRINDWLQVTHRNYWDNPDGL